MTGNIRVLAEICEQNHIKWKENVRMDRYTTMEVGGPAALLVKPETVDQWRTILQELRRQDLPWMVLGRGSNLLFPDDGFPGAVLRMSGMNQWEVVGRKISADAGAPLSRICREAQRYGLAGMAFAYGIPGSVGGAVVMNAGAYGGEMADVVAQATILDSRNGEILTLERGELHFSYRHSIFREHPEWILLSAQIWLEPGDPEQIAREMEQYLRQRKDKQPLHQPSAGSYFKRPAGAYAGKLIEECGLKGLRVGGAAVSEKHAGFIVNTGNATTADILALAEQVREIVHRETGYLLEPEVLLVDAAQEARK